MTVADRLASLAVVIADLNVRLSRAEHSAVAEEKRADTAEAKLKELEAKKPAPRKRRS